ELQPAEVAAPAAPAAPAPAAAPAAPAPAPVPPAPAPAKAREVAPVQAPEKVVIEGHCHARRLRAPFYGTSPDLLWQCVRKSSCFQRPGGVNKKRFSAEPGNLLGLHCQQYSGLAGDRALDVRPKQVGQKRSIELVQSVAKVKVERHGGLWPERLWDGQKQNADQRLKGRGLATSPVRAHRPAIQALQASQEDSPVGTLRGGAMLAGSPLFLTDLDAPMYWTEIQFVLSGPINGLFERMFETEAGPLFLNGVFLLTLMRMGVYYGFMQPSYLWHFQERYGQTWTVGHHLNGSDLPNPLKKGK
ncbi:unnamed protein product, partial [Effrenium voratum]